MGSKKRVKSTQTPAAQPARSSKRGSTSSAATSAATSATSTSWKKVAKSMPPLSAAEPAAPVVEDDATAVSTLKELASAVIKDRKQVNNVVALLRYTQEEQYSDEVLFHALQSLDRVWLHLIDSDPSFLTEDAPSAAAAVNDASSKRKRTTAEDGRKSTASDAAAVASRHQLYQWLRRQYSNYCNRLNALVFHEQPAVQLMCVRNLMQAVRLMSGLSTASRANAAALFSQFVQSLVSPPSSVVDSERLVDEVSEDALDELCTAYLSAFPDLLHRCFVSVRKVLQRCKRNSREKAIRDRTTQAKQAQLTKMPATDDQDAEQDGEDADENERQREAAAVGHGAAPATESAATERELAQKLLATRAYLLLRLLPDPASSLRAADEPFFVPLLGDEPAGKAELDETSTSAADRKREKRKRKRGKKLAQTADLPDDITLRRSFSACWMEFLSLPLPVSVYKGVLAFMHNRILPQLLHPTRLFVFLRDSFDLGGLASLLSLHSLFILITQYNLEYPNFFEKLYSLFEPSIFFARHREEFWKLSSMFLSSRHLPAYLVAAFVKRLARISLFAPPAGCLSAIALLYNLLKKHPAVRKLVHQTVAPQKPSGDGVLVLSSTWQPDEQSSSAADPYLADEVDPAKCKALESSLWELEALGKHYSPAVVRFVGILKKEYVKQPYDLTPFSSSSYHTLLQSMCLKKLKTPPALEYYEPHGLFGATTRPLSMKDATETHDSDDDDDGYDDDGAGDEDDDYSTRASASSAALKRVSESARQMEAVNASAICYFSV